MSDATTYPPTGGAWEIIPSERDKYWTVNQDFTINYKGKQFTVPAGFKHDCYTFVPDLPDPVPAIVHDAMRQAKKWNDGTPITFKVWNAVFLHLCQRSSDVKTRRWGLLYWFGLYHLRLGLPVWLSPCS